MVIGGGAVTIGEDCLIGPRCSIYTPNHAEDIERRLAGWELPQPVTIGSNVWLGGSVTLTPGVTIGDNSIIGAGSVVTHDIPAGVLAAGNPARVLRPIRTSEDSA
jgi:maltose O-acetyltransferase